MRLGNADFAIEEGSYRDIRSSRERRKGKRESTKVDGTRGSGGKFGWRNREEEKYGGKKGGSGKGRYC